ncbi:MAG TPA: DUF5522 domain-containing protein [Edaphobacter sp.]|nr:DUF5522 domain-containing protein [Edaphobacter sp.]
MFKPDNHESDMIPQQDTSELEPEDFYYEGPYQVFTEHYLRKRGYCCNSGCRHCPYK